MGDPAAVISMNSTYRIIKRSRRPGIRGAGRKYSRFGAELLQFFAFHRTATANHVQRSFHELFGTERSTRMHLQTLVARDELCVARDCCTAPNVYLATDRGLRAAGKISSKSNRPPLGSHLLHELLITEFAVSINEMTRTRPDIRIPWQRRFDLAIDSAFQGLVPDYAFLFSHPTGSLICFAEVFSGEESSFRMGQKLVQYAAWESLPSSKEALMDIYQLNGARNVRPVFRLLAIAHNRRSDADESRLAQFMNEALDKMPPELHRRVWGTTAKALENESVAARWIRAVDLRSTTEVPAEVATKGSTEVKKRKSHRSMMAALNQAPRYPLFPSASQADDVPTQPN